MLFINIPLFYITICLAINDFLSQNFRFDLNLVCLHGLDNLVIIFYRYTDLIHNLKASLFTHGLYFTNDLADKSLFDQLRCQVGIQNNCSLAF